MTSMQLPISPGMDFPSGLCGLHGASANEVGRHQKMHANDTLSQAVPPRSGVSGCVEHEPNVAIGFLDTGKALDEELGHIWRFGSNDRHAIGHSFLQAYPVPPLNSEADYASEGKPVPGYNGSQSTRHISHGYRQVKA